MLFGLEGSGFIISLAITLLLTGLIMFYVRQRFSEVQENIDKLSQIVPVMTEQMNIHNIQIQEMRAGSVGATLTSAPTETLETINEESDKIDVSEDDEDEDSDDDDDESDNDEDDSDDEASTNDIKNIQLGSEIANNDNIMVEEVPDNNTKVIDVDNLGVEEVLMDPPTESDSSPGNEKLEVESLDDDSDDDDDDSDDEPTTAEVVIKKIEASVEDKFETKPDFSKLSVAALREKAASLENVAVDVSKMKKKELLKLFE